MNMKGFLLYTQVRGVFLGLVTVGNGTLCAMWSGDSLAYARPDCAVVFDSAEAAHRFADQFEPPPEGLEVVPVTADFYNEATGLLWASVDAVQKAGLAPWLLVTTETRNTLPI